MALFRDANRGPAIGSQINPVWGSGIEKVLDGTAHGGVVVNDKDSGLASESHRCAATITRPEKTTRANVRL